MKLRVYTYFCAKQVAWLALKSTQLKETVMGIVISLKIWATLFLKKCGKFLS